LNFLKENQTFYQEKFDFNFGEKSREGCAVSDFGTSCTRYSVLLQAEE